MRRLVILTSLVAVIVLGLFTYGAASAGTASVTIGGVENFTPNALVNSTFHFRPGPITIHTGDTVSFTNTTSDVHTISLVKKGDLPTSIDQVFECNICNIIFSHLVPPSMASGNGLSGVLMTPSDSSQPNLVGDSVWVNPAGAPGSTISVKVTAPAGTTLNYMCAIHPWMQGTIYVK